MADKCVYMFPGQGSQSVGMRGKLGEMTDAQRDLFGKADEILGFPLGLLIDRGPEDELTRTSNTQPALLVMGIAFAMAADMRGRKADIVMGHSLGEYTALAHGGVIGFEDALRIVRRRGELMEQAVQKTPGRMAAVIGGNRQQLEEILEQCRGDGVIEITNFNSPMQVVLSGEISPLKRAMAIINESGAAKAVELNVSAPFHSSLMVPMADEFRDFLDAFDFHAPAVQFIDNVSGLPEADPARIREKLIMQLSKPVQWEQSVLTAAGDGAGLFIECGPGTVLSGLVKRIARGPQILPGERMVQG